MSRHFLSLMVLLFVTTSCTDRETLDVSRDEGIFAAQRAPGSEGGIGGTGAPLGQRVDNGEGAEGGIGGTGIFGTITSFGSIVVNGLTIDFDDDIVLPQASVVGQSLPLTVGSAVLVEAERSDGVWNARQIALFLPVVGPVSSINEAGGDLRVMGTSIIIDSDTEMVDRLGGAGNSPLDMKAIAPGDRLAVSGLWKGGEVIASRIDRLNADGPASLRGLMLGTGDSTVIGGTRLAPNCCDGLETPVFANLTGRYQDGLFEILDLQTGATLLFSDAVDQLVVEAFLARDPDGVGFHLSGFGIPADQSATLATEPGVRSLFVGRLDDTFLVQDSIALPSERGARIDLLRAFDGIIAPN